MPAHAPPAKETALALPAPCVHSNAVDVKNEKHLPQSRLPPKKHPAHPHDSPPQESSQGTLRPAAKAASSSAPGSTLHIHLPLGPRANWRQNALEGQVGKAHLAAAPRASRWLAASRSATGSYSAIRSAPPTRSPASGSACWEGGAGSQASRLGGPNKHHVSPQRSTPYNNVVSPRSFSM